jgi:hypothetical protein
VYLPSGGYSRQNGVSALGAFKTGQVHFVHEAVHILSSSSASNSTRTYYIPLIKGICSLEDIISVHSTEQEKEDANVKCM